MTPERIKQLQRIAEQAGAGFQSQTNQTVSKPKKDFWTDQISTGGGIGGSLAGAAGGAALGSIVPGVGTVIGGLAGAILGGAAGSGGGEIAENYITGEGDKFKNVGKEAFFGGAFAAPPLKIARGALGAAKGLATGAAKEGFEQGFTKSAVGNVGRKAEQTGQQLLTAQANIPRGMARQLNVGEMFSNLNKYGLNRLEDIADIAPKITGESGLMSAGVRKAVSKTPGVDTEGFRDIAQSLIENNGTLLQPFVRKNVTNDITQVLTKTAGGARGSLNPLANPLDVFDAVKALEKKGASFGRGKAANMLTPDEQGARSIYNGMAAELKDRLFNAPGIENALPVIKESMAAQVENLARTTGKPGLVNLAKDIRSATDVAQLRKLQSPFVRGGQVAAETALSEATSGLSLAQGAKGIGRAGNLTQIAAPALEAFNAPVGSGLINAGKVINRVTGGASQTSSRYRSPLAYQATLGSAKNSLFPSDPGSLEDALMQQGGSYGAESDSGLGGYDLGGMQQEQQDPYPRQNLMADIQRDPQNADKYLAYYQEVQKAFAPPEQPKLSATQQSTAVRAQNALNDLNVLGGAIEDGTLLKTGVPGSGTAVGGNLLGTTDVEAALFNIGDVILRSRTGAQAPESEIRKFVSGFLPRAGESKQAQTSKLQRAYRELSGMINPPAALGSGSANGLEDALMNYQ